MNMAPENRARIVAAVKEAHRLGRCAPSVSEAANRKRSESLKAAFAVRPIPIETRLRVGALNGKRQLGRKIPLGWKSAAGPDHFLSKFWLLRTPDRRILIGPNLNEIIRRNSHLFDPRDVAGPVNRCRARKGLNGLFELRKRNGGFYVMEQWKGWTAVNKAEMVKDVGVPFSRLKFKPTFPEKDE